MFLYFSLFQTTPQFRAEYSEFLNDFRHSDLYKGNSTSLYVAYETLSYDAVWTLAIALNKTENVIQEDGISLADFQYARSSPDNPTEFNDSINNYISYNLSRFVSQTDFEGVSVSGGYQCILWNIAMLLWFITTIYLHVQ